MAWSDHLKSRDGSTLAEVLIAMVILAVGLLALEAMGIGASRQVTRADRNSEYTALATTEMEQVIGVVDAGQVPASSDRTVNGVRIQRVVTAIPVTGRRMYQVSVTLTPPSNTLRLQPLTVVGSVLR